MICYLKNFICIILIIFKLIDNKNIDGYFYDKQKKKPICKMEVKGPLQIECKPKFIRKQKLLMPNTPKFNMIDDVEDNYFQPLVKKIIDECLAAVEATASAEPRTVAGTGSCTRQPRKGLWHSGRSSYPPSAPSDLLAKRRGRTSYLDLSLVDNRRGFANCPR